MDSLILTLGENPAKRAHKSIKSRWFFFFCLIYSLALSGSQELQGERREDEKGIRQERLTDESDRVWGKVSRQIVPRRVSGIGWGKCENECHVELRQNLVGATWEGSSSLRFVKVSHSQPPFVLAGRCQLTLLRAFVLFGLDAPPNLFRHQWATLYTTSCLSGSKAECYTDSQSRKDPRSSSAQSKKMQGLFCITRRGGRVAKMTGRQ